MFKKGLSILLIISLIVTTSQVSLGSLETIDSLEAINISQAGTDINAAIEEYNNLGIINAGGDIVTTTISEVDASIYAEHGYLIKRNSLPLEGIRYQDDEPEVLGMAPDGTYVKNPNFSPDANSGKAYDNRSDYLYNNIVEDRDKMELHDTLGDYIDGGLKLNEYYNSLPASRTTIGSLTGKEYQNAIYLGMLIGYLSMGEAVEGSKAGDTDTINHTQDIEDAFITAYNEYVVTKDLSVFRDVEFIDSSDDEPFAIDKAAVFMAMPTLHNAGRYVIFRESGWYLGVTIPPLSNIISEINNITATAHLTATTPVDSDTTSITSSFEFTLTSTEDITSYELFDISPNISITEPLTADITGTASHIGTEYIYTHTIPLTINLTGDGTSEEVFISVRGTNASGNIAEDTASIIIDKTVSIVIPGENTDSSGNSSTDGAGGLTIGSNQRNNELFDTTQGIPTNENLYVQILTDKYMAGYSYSTERGSETFTATITGEWEETDGSTTPFSEDIEVRRSYAYRDIDTYYIYEIASASVTNGALPSDSLIMMPSNDSLSASVNEGGKGASPDDETVNVGVLPRGTELDSYARNAIDDYNDRDDKLIFNGTTYSLSEGIPHAPTISDDVLYEEGITIDKIHPNGIFSSSAVVTYQLAYDYNNASGQPDTKTVTLTGNDVVVHTPVACDGAILNNADYDQQIDTNNQVATVVLGMDTKLRLLTSGVHKSILGYGGLAGEEKDYESYTYEKQVSFPFDVYLNTTYQEEGKYLAAGTWTSIPLDADVVDFYVPTWVDEGDYAISFRTIAHNASDYSLEETAVNLNYNNYVATDTVNVEVVGRLYGFKITDIGDYPLWEKVFRVSEGSTEHSGQCYYVGTKDENGEDKGIDNTFTFPLLEGSHPNYDNIGAVKTGYHFKFELETIGDYSGEYDCISIKPTFYYVQEDGSNRQEVDIYYHEYYNDTTNYFVKIDDNKNRENTKFITLGDSYRSVSNQEIADTSRVLGIEEDDFSNQASKIGWFDWLVLSQPIRTYVGDVANLPSGVNGNDVLTSVQHWYGEYYLPNDVFVAPKDYDIYTTTATNGGLDGDESFWLTDGYIIINFEIETIKDGDFDNPVLSYTNGGNASMWEVEGYNQTKTDSNGVNFRVEQGDVIYYYTDEKASDDYGVSGTH